MLTMHDDVETILFTQHTLSTRVEELGRELTIEYADKNVLAICVLKGASMFYADLCRQMDCPIEMEFMRVSSYGMTSTSGILTIKKDVECSVTNRHILIVEDIIDTGRTLTQLTQMLKCRNATSVKVVCMFDKPSRRVNSFKPNYYGFQIPDEFVVGYGLDYAEKYRNLPYVGVLKHSIYEK